MAKQILVFEEKHGNRYYDASDAAAVERALRAVFRERFNSGYWYYRIESGEYTAPKNVEEALSLTDEQVAALPDGLRRSQEALRQSGRRERRDATLAYAKENIWFSLAETVANLPEDDSPSGTQPKTGQRHDS